MTLEEIYYIGQTIAAVAILGSLLSIFFQQWQANKMARLAMAQRVSSNYSNRMREIMSNQTVAVVVILASLIFVGLQLRQTERNQRTMMQQVRTDRGIALSMCFTDGPMTEIMRKLIADEPEFSGQEQVRLTSYVRSLSLNLLDAHSLHQMKYLSDAAFERACAGSRWFFAMPRARATWDHVRAQFTPLDAALIPAMTIDGVPLSARSDLAASASAARKALLPAAPESGQQHRGRTQ